MSALVVRRREFFVYREVLILGEALRRKDFGRVSDIVQSAVVRSLCIPPQLLSGDSNYSGAHQLPGDSNYTGRG